MSEWTVSEWTEGIVDQAQEHIALHVGEDPEPVALVAPLARDRFAVQVLRPDHPGLEVVRRELTYYLVKLEERDPWAYALYHCTSAANLYAPVRWRRIPNKPGDRSQGRS